MGNGNGCSLTILARRCRLSLYCARHGPRPAPPPCSRSTAAGEAKTRKRINTNAVAGLSEGQISHNHSSIIFEIKSSNSAVTLRIAEERHHELCELIKQQTGAIGQRPRN
jgi:hypothetical protein